MKKKRTNDSRGNSQRLFPIEGLIEYFRERDIRSLPGRFVLRVDQNGNLRTERRSDIEGVPIPKDLELICGAEARDEARLMEHVLTIDAEGWSVHEDLSLPIRYQHVLYFESVVADALETGFRLALRRYAEDLKHVPEAAALLEKEQTRKETARRNGKVRAEKAAPTHKAIRKRFRELRKTIPKKTVRYLRVAKEFGKSDRQIARIVDGID